jgi:alkylation response protein AidB-like acyl-CoA dehydrogenase
MRFTTLATLTPEPGRAPGTEANVAKLIWGPWHQRLGELAVDVAGAAATLVGPGYELDNAQRLFLFTRAETIYGGSSEIQRTVVAERKLGLPREAR